MKRALKFLTLFTTFFSVLTLGGNDLAISASSSTAAIKGFSVSGWTYVSDYDYGWDDFYGTMYYAGATKMWTAFYQSYNQTSDTMYYMVLNEAGIKPNPSTTTSTQNGWTNERINVNYSVSSNQLTLVAYDPLPQNSTYSYSSSITINSDGVLIVTYTETTTTPEITISNDAYDQSLDIGFFFTRYSHKLFSSGIYHGTITRKSYAIFELDDYSAACSDSLDFRIAVNYTGTTFRDGFWNDAHNSNTLSDHHDFAL
jgi:hypothetical protein